MPKGILAVRKIDPRLTYRDVQTMLLHRAQERHLDVQVVLTERVVDHVGRPFRHVAFGNNPSAISELRRRAPAYAGDLPDPSALHLVAVLFDGNLAVRLPVDNDVFRDRAGKGAAINANATAIKNDQFNTFFIEATSRKFERGVDNSTRKQYHYKRRFNIYP